VNPAACACLVLGVAATIEDLAWRRISNWIPLAAATSGMLLHARSAGWKGIASAAFGLGAGFCVFLVFYLLGGMGGGDVKLMAGFGAIVGIERLLPAAFWAAAIGGLMACAALAVEAGKNRRRRRLAGQPRSEKTGIASIPYAPAIVAGALLSLVP